MSLPVSGVIDPFETVVLMHCHKACCFDRYLGLVQSKAAQPVIYCRIPSTLKISPSWSSVVSRMSADCGDSHSRAAHLV